MTLGWTKRLAALLLAMSMSIVLMSASVGSADPSLPPPVGPSAELVGGAVQLNWSAPTTSSGMINQTGCDSTNQSMTYIFENFTRDYPAIEVVLRGGGNNYGFAQWIAHDSDVDQASRGITDAEAQQARAAGLNVTETKVGVECVAIIAHPSVGASELTTDQLKGIFNGTIANWKEVGGADLPIVLFGPLASKSPHLFFTNAIMVGTDYAKIERHADPVELGKRVANTTGAIGFVRSGYLANISGVEVMKLNGGLGGPSTSPLNLSAVYGLEYPLARYFRLYTNGAMEGRTGAWAQYILDPDHGQRILAENGFIPLTESDRRNSTAHIASTSDDPVLRYLVYRQSGDSRAVIAEVANSTSYRDTNVTTGAAYSYWISAVYASGEGAMSQPLNVTISSTAGPGDLPLPGGTSGSGAALIAILGALALAVVVILGLIFRRR